MSERRLANLEAIFQSVVDLPPEERERVLAERCGSDDELRGTVERLLANHNRGIGDFLQAPTRPAATPTSAREVSLPFRVGHYEIVRKLGEGGMGDPDY